MRGNVPEQVQGHLLKQTRARVRRAVSCSDNALFEMFASWRRYNQVGRSTAPKECPVRLSRVQIGSSIDPRGSRPTRGP